MAGELLRLIAGHPQPRSSPASSRTASRASRWRRRSGIWRLRIRTRSSLRIEEIERAGRDAAAQRDLLRRAAWRVGGADRPAADEGRSRGHEAARRRYLGRLPLRHATRPTPPCTSTRMARRTGSRSSPARCRSISPARRRRTSAHPGCFATAILLASVPLLKLGLVDAARCSSAASPAAPAPAASRIEGTHHPMRHSDLYAYNALAHRHAPEVRGRAPRPRAACDAHFAFVPHSGPFARGIHVTVQATAARSPPATAAAAASSWPDFYAHSPFVQRAAPPRRA